jgi:DNA-binding PadR family transcriptional regulator
VTTDFRNLELKNALSIILYLYRAGRVQKTELYKKVSYTTTMPSKLEFLEKEGFIRTEHLKFKNNTKYIELTEKGIALAIHLQNAEDAISGKEQP